MYLECRHILPSGVRCKSPALRGMSFCYHHESLRRFSSLNSSPEKQPLQLPSIEEPRGIQIALAQILAALASGRIEPRRASLMLYGLQIAAQLAARTKDPVPQHIVRDTFQENQGDPLAPEQSACEPPEDCPTCSLKDTCTRDIRVQMRRSEALREAMRQKCAASAAARTADAQTTEAQKPTTENPPAASAPKPPRSAPSASLPGVSPCPANSCDPDHTLGRLTD